MYVSKYYTCEEIDQRLLQGYYDDSLAHGLLELLKSSGHSSYQLQTR